MPAIEARALSVGFRTERGVVQALSDASFAIERGETLVVIGESGSGKTVLAHALMRLLPRNVTLAGEVDLEGQPLLALPEDEMRRVRGRRMALIPQGAGSALNPVRRVGGLMLEMARVRGLGQGEAREALDGSLRELGLSFQQVAERYPHQLSGGMQQRVVNAMAMVGEPSVVIADEPTHGMDPELVDTTAEQLGMIARRGAALLVITHDLRLAERLGGRTALIYSSYIVELRDTAAFFSQPEHPYGRALLGALPEHGGVAIPGVSPELTQLPRACAFAPRCPARFEPCDEAVPPMFPLPGGGEARCYLHA
ncbi:MAG: ABC transporter ATP-binding protein [Dehalococcoidia bacterium]|nr:ABC transporter ATP-binding protein [Dehalococcoidia bacterium]